MNKTLLAVLATSLLLVGCGSTPERVVTVTNPVVVVPPESMYNCPDLPPIPSAGTTDVAIAEYVLDLYKSGRLCKESLEDVRRFLIDAKKLADKQK